MSDFHVAPGQTLTYSADGGVPVTLTFEAGDFTVPEQPTAEEIAAAIDARGDRLAADVTPGGKIVLTGATLGSGATLEIDLAASTAAPALGLTAGPSSARGTGLETPRLVSLKSEPFALARGAELMLTLDGRNRRVEFTTGFTPGSATAAEVSAAIEDVSTGVARPTRDGRVMLTGRSVGARASLAVTPPRDERKPNAAEQIGFVGTAAASHPHATAPPRIALTGQEPGVAAVSLVGTVVDLHTAAGVTRIAPGGLVPLDPLEAADPNLQRLIEQGVVRLEARGAT